MVWEALDFLPLLLAGCTPLEADFYLVCAPPCREVGSSPPPPPPMKYQSKHHKLLGQQKHWTAVFAFHSNHHLLVSGSSPHIDYMLPTSR